MTEHTQRELLKLGWRPGDPVPGDLGRIITEMQARVQKDKEEAGEAAAQSTQPKPRVGRLVSIDELNPKDQQSLRQYLQDHKEAISRAALIDQARAAEEARLEEDVEAGTVPQAVAQGLSAMSQAIRPQASSQPEAVIVGPLPGVKVPEGKRFGGNLGVPLTQPPPPPVQQQPPQQAPTATPEPDATTTQTGDHECARCGYDRRVPFSEKPSREDIEQFGVALLALQVFRKKYSLLNGKCLLTFRGLASKDVILVNKQLGYDVRAGKIIGDGEYLTSMLEYRLVLSLQHVEVQGHMAVDVPNVDAYAKANPTKLPADPSKATILVAMHEDFYDKYVASESLRRIVGAKHREFQRLSETLEAMSLDPNFTNGIALSV